MGCKGIFQRISAEDLGGGDVKGFLTDLAVRQGVAASTRNQAFNALLFFYRHVLGREFGKLEGVARAKRHRYVPVVLPRAEVEAVLSELEPRYRLVALLLYGCGLRLSECLGLRVQCFNLDAMLLTVHDDHDDLSADRSERDLERGEEPVGSGSGSAPGVKRVKPPRMAHPFRTQCVCPRRWTANVTESEGDWSHGVAKGLFFSASRPRNGNARAETVSF